MPGYHLAQFNIARMVAPLDSEEMSGFVAGLEPINALADGAPGFVWRLQTEEGDATSLRPYDDDTMIVNLGVWESVEALAAFTYESDHLRVLRQRRQWFQRMAEAYLVLWWIPAGTIPTVEQAKARLTMLQERGPNPEAFTFRKPFPPPDAAPDEEIEPADGWLCPT
jgi:hypothetical protein